MNTVIPNIENAPKLFSHSAIHWQGKDGKSPVIITFLGKDVHIYNIRTNNWSTPSLSGEGPSKSKWGHTASLINQAEMIVFGGSGNIKVKSLDLHSWNWKTVAQL